MASTKKDMRREDLVVPYVPSKDKAEGDISSTVSSTLPMAAMVTKNKYLGWASVVFAIQSWLAETPEQRRAATTPGYFSVLMAVLSLAISYLPLFLPPVVPKRPSGGSGTQAPPPVPPEYE